MQGSQEKQRGVPDANVASQSQENYARYSREGGTGGLGLGGLGLAVG